MREAEIQDLGPNIGGRNISNARYADDTALIAQSPMEMQQLLDKVNAAGAQRLLKLNVKKTKLMTIGDVPDDITIRVNNDPVEKVKQFKYLGSLKGALYRIQILCQRYTFWSYPAGLTIAAPPG